MLADQLSLFAACGSNSFIPAWDQYLGCEGDSIVIDNINDVWLIAWGLVDVILFIGSIAAVFFLIYGGIQFITSQGAPDKTGQARKTITYAVVGLVIAVLGQVLVEFIAGQFNVTVEL